VTIDIAHETEVVNVTDDARSHVLSVRATEPNAEALALWLEVSGVLDGNYVYDMYFQPKTDANPDDFHFYNDGDLSVIVPRADVAKLLGATLRMSSDNDGGMEITNPNKPAVLENPAEALQNATLDSDIARLVTAVLDEQVNPAIAGHGGAAQLVGVDEDTAYLVLSGGCQGCSMSKMTLTQGIIRAIQESVPQIKNVVDVTDHTAGANPFYH
jgi:Fe/S biogenesis protein NfuA